MQLPSLVEARKRTKSEIKFINYVLNEKYKNIGKGKTYYVKTYGCQMNEHDSENICGLLESIGFIKNDDMEQSDLVILNTCSIRENAHNKAFGMLGRLKHLKEERPNLIVGLCGCMAQEEVVVDEILSKYRHVNFVFGTHNLYDLPRLIFENTKKTNVCVYSGEGMVIEDLPVKRVNNFKAYVNIIYGCDKFCTYCIVPYTRGKQRSRKMEDILEEVEMLYKEGYQEVTLLGQNVNAYGKDLNLGYDLGDLLIKVSGVARIMEGAKNIILIVFMATASSSAATVANIAQSYQNEAEKASVINVMSILFLIVTLPIMVVLYQLWI